MLREAAAFAACCGRRCYFSGKVHTALITLHTLASGSEGNCLLVSADDTHLLVDAGISARRIKQSLALLGLTPDDLSAILISHEHTDHTAGLATLLKHHPIPLYATGGTAFYLRPRLPQLDSCLHLVSPDSSFSVGPAQVTVFATSHDAGESVDYRVDCGGCNGCEIEIFATLSPLFDAERFGIKVVPSPRHADILLFTGAVTRAMRSPALRAWQSAPDPKICISYGACGNSGGIFHDLYCVWGGTDKIVPVDVYIPGCPPTPAATLYGFAMALGLLEQKIHARGPGELDEQPAEILHGDMVQPLRVKVDREARRLAGYRYGRQIADDYLTQLGQGEEQVARWLEAENDPRLNEIVSHLNHVVEEARIR